MKVKAKRVLLHDKLGRIVKGQEVDLPEALAKDYLKRDWVQKYDTKVVNQEPEAGADGTQEQQQGSGNGPVEGELTVDVATPKSTKAKAK